MASLSDLLRSVETLGPQLESITSVLKHASDANLSETTTNLGSASAALSRLLYFLHTASSLRRNSLPASIAARTNGELQSLIAQIFCALAITEGVSLEGSHNSDVALAELKAFQESRVSPMMREFSRVKEDALARVSRCEKEVEVANSNLENAQSLLEGNTVTVAATSKHLDAVQCHINTMSSQLDSYGVRMRELERRKANAKERRQVSSVCVRSL